MLRDLQFALRSLRCSPAFALTTIAILAIGIGATTTVFSLVDSVLLRALPYHQPDRLVEVFGQDDQRSGMRVPEPILQAVREKSRTITALAIHSPTASVLSTPEGLVDVRGTRVSANFFDVLGVSPLMGRGFGSIDEQPGAAATVVVSFAFWQRFLGGDRDAVGRTIYLSKLPFTVVGVMAAGFKTKFSGISNDYWTTQVPDTVRSLERNAGYELIARLAGGVTLAQARAESESITQSVLVSGWRGGERRLGMHALQYEIVRDTGRPLQLLLVAVAVVLAAACANLAQLLLVRADARARDYAVRKALGAEPRAILRLALLESGLLAVAGGSAGVALSYALLPALLMLAPTEIPRLTDAQIDTRVLLVSLVVSVATGLAFGIVPAVRMARLPAREVLARGGHVARGGVPVFRAVLIVMQVAASVALCALAGLVGRTFLTLLPSAPGFDATARAVFSVPAFTVRDADQRLARLEAIVGRLRQHPAIDDVAISSNVPFSGDHFDVPVRSPEDQRAASAIGLRTDVRSVSANVFDVLGIAVMRGRRFTPQDTAIAPRVAIVNQALARALGDDADVLGQRIRVGSSATAPVCEIVGIVGNSRSLGDRVDILNEVYMPLTQSVDSLPYLIVKSSLAIDELTFVIRREVRTVMPEVPLRVDARAQSLAALMRDAVATPRFSATLVSGFSAAALVLALLGISGMIRCSIVQRYRELGIRSALGAKPRQLVIATVQSVVLLTCAGIAVGLVVARYFNRLIASQLYGVSPTDAATFTAAALLMIAVSALAAFLPARGASRVDPVVALRQDG